MYVCISISYSISHNCISTPILHIKDISLPYFSFTFPPKLQFPNSPIMFLYFLKVNIKFKNTMAMY